MQCEACGQANLEGARFCANCGALLASEQKGPDPMIGQLVGGRFRVTGVLGEGGMGIVYVGEQQMGSTLRKVAIKTLHAHLSKDPSVLARFHRECGTIAELEHPNTIKVYDFGSTTDGTLYIAMEFVSGKPLADVIREERQLAPERVVNILRQICGALDEAHQKGIIHRDLKPENVILSARSGEGDFVKVLDFGIASRSESADAHKEQKLTQQGMVLGTPPYMSPEQFTGKALDRRSDVYSLGVMTYEMLTGRLPFDADTPWQWATQHMTAQPMPFETAAPAHQIPVPMREAIFKALAKDREQRQATARDFFKELSDGGRVTVEAAPPVTTGTAAMDRMPDFSSAAHAPAVVAGRMAGVAAGAVAALPVPPVTGRRSSGGGKGLVVGLGALGAVLLVAIAVVAARSLKPAEDEPVLTSPFGSTSAGAVTTIAPTEVAPTVPTSSVGTSAGTDPVVAKPPTTTPATIPKTSSTGASPSTATGGGTTPKPASGSCDLCESYVRSGNLAAAGAALRGCTDAAKKDSCARLIKGSAKGAAQQAAFNGNCQLAQQIIAVGAAAGASRTSLEGALKNTSCK